MWSLYTNTRTIKHTRLHTLGFHQLLINNANPPPVRWVFIGPFSSASHKYNKNQVSVWSVFSLSPPGCCFSALSCSCRVDAWCFAGWAARCRAAVWGKGPRSSKPPSAASTLRRKWEPAPVWSLKRRTYRESITYSQKLNDNLTDPERSWMILWP